MVLQSFRQPYIAFVLGVFFVLSLVSTTLLVPTTEAAFTLGKRTFKVTAYYSPLPGQSFYAKGSYEADVRLNGQGVAGASGRPVFPGMLAAPKDYPFGTKIYLEGLGVGTVADRGGAIVNAGKRGQEYERIDVWMGYGEEGLRRSMQWGVRIVDGEVYASKDIADTISFDTSVPPKTTIRAKDPEPEVAKLPPIYLTFSGAMGKGATGDSVKLLQSALSKLGLLKSTITGVYDDATMNAVLAFQLQKNIVEDSSTLAAGYFGIQTRKLLIDTLVEKGITMADLEAQVRVASQPAKKLEPVVSKPTIAVVEKKPQPAQQATPKKPQAQPAPVVTPQPTKAAVVAPAKKPQETKVPVVSKPTIPLASGSKIVWADEIDGKAYQRPATLGPRQAPIPLSIVETRALQRQLRSLGHFEGEFTGLMGDTTKRALATIQRQGNLVVQDGTYTMETKEYIEGLWDMHIQTWGFANRLEKGDTGTDVQKLQKLLSQQGFYKGEVDGIFDDEVEKSLLAFQLKHRIVDSRETIGAGTVGPNTMRQLNTMLFRLQ